MAVRHHHRRQLLQSIQIVHIDELRVFVPDEQILPILGQGHPGGRGSGAQGANGKEPGAVEDQHLVAVLPEHVETVAHRIRQQVHECSRHICGSSSFIRPLVAYQNANCGW